MTLLKQYNDHVKDERCKFRRRVKRAITVEEKKETHELPADAEFIETIAGEVCNVSADIALNLAMERKPTLPKMDDEAANLRSAQEKDPYFGSIIEALEDKLNKDLPQITKQSLKSEMLK